MPMYVYTMYTGMVSRQAGRVTGANLAGNEKFDFSLSKKLLLLQVFFTFRIRTMPCSCTMFLNTSSASFKSLHSMNLTCYNIKYNDENFPKSSVAIFS